MHTLLRNLNEEAIWLAVREVKVKLSLCFYLTVHHTMKVY